MKYADIKHCDVANGTGVRTSLFVSGCTHRCRGCFNEIAWDFNYGNEFTDEAVQEILDSCGKSYISGLSLLGGEPMEPQNQRALLPLVLRFKELYPEKTIWCKLKFRGSSNQRVLQIHEPGCPELFAEMDR